MWDVVGSLNDTFGMLGFLIIGIFALSWLVSIAVYRLKGYDAARACSLAGLTAVTAVSVPQQAGAIRFPHWNKSPIDTGRSGSTSSRFHQPPPSAWKSATVSA